MTLYKYINRLVYMDQLIRQKRTGTAVKFASQLGIGVSQLREHIRDLKDLGSPIYYCSNRRSYCYADNGRFVVKYKTT